MLATIGNMFGAVILIATINERLVEIIIKPILGWFGQAENEKLINLLSVGLGVLIAFGLDLDFLTIFLGELGVVPMAAWIGDRDWETSPRSA